MDKEMSAERLQQFRAWRAEAKRWVLDSAVYFIEQEHKNATSNPGITVGQIVAYLDDLRTVPGYELLRHEPALRYQLVRSIVEGAAKEGKLRVGTTTNTRGRTSNSFSPVNWQPAPTRRSRRPSMDTSAFEIEVEAGADRAEVERKVKEKLADINDITGLHSVYVIKPPAEEPTKSRRLKGLN